MLLYLVSVFCGFHVRRYRHRKEAIKKGESENYRGSMGTKWKYGVDNKFEEVVTTIRRKRAFTVLRGGN